ncbi:Ig-like domain-containing protein [Actinoplanes teichomyceticus]|uniref:DNA-binding beta-propeller fold protein YncE n=1 Tax=Actinoplanes teichomyceticus TaxID=1867 RepID=A0A561WQX7_ACTTI|nr:Ig-like domain-containing protein [Actinoplanes teichomyceticus]TWG26275.1 hypothetical protein FHX34_1011256 [Actinoplanes teichomyceticus]GIF11354.1 hypothetical protein Ate01nite_13860 [Actinoplanes teichomyceticus]
MRNRRIGAATVAVLTGTAALAVGAAAPALADSGEVVSITSVGDVLIDGAHQRVFVSDPAGGKVVVTDYRGAQIGSAPVNDATNLELSADSSQLYVTSPNGLAIFALDTTTLAPTAKYATGGFPPKDVAVAGGRLWFSYADGSSGNLGTIDPAAETPVPRLNRLVTGWTGVAELAAASGAPNRLGVASHGLSAILDVSGDSITTVGSVTTNQEVTDLAIAPDGTRIATVFPGDYVVTLRDADDLAAARRLPVEPYPTAVDIATDGTVVSGSSSTYGDPNVHVFTPAGDLIKQFTLPDLGDMQRHAVAWEPNGDRLFTVSKSGVDTFTLRTHTDPKHAPSRLSLSGPGSAPVPGAAITIRGTLTSSVPLPAGTSVTVSRAGTALGASPVGPDGAFTFTDTPPAADTVTYQVSYAGDGNHSPVTETILVGIARAASALTVSGPSATVPGAAITLTGTLTSPEPLPAGTSVTLSRAGTALGTGPVGPDGAFTFTDTPPVTGTVTYQVSYPGDDTHLPASTTVSVQVSRTASTLTLTGPSAATRAKPLTLTGKLSSQQPLAAGTTVSVSRTDLDHPAGTSLGTRTVGADGSFTVTDTPAAGGTVTYRVSYAGDTTHTPATATRAVAVSRSTPALTLTNHGKVYAYGQTVSFTAHLGSTYRNRTVEIWADPSGGDQARRLLKRGVVNSAGNLTASLKLTRDTTLSAVFTGDSRTAPRTVTATVGAKVSLSLKLSRYYKTAKISGTTYRYYHAKTDARFSTSMTAGATRKVYITLQRYSGGKWRDLDNGYFEATDQLLLSSSGLTGVKLRVRTAYVKGGSGDSLNSTTWTPYQYLYFTK